jgi:hypothetical protein
MTDYTYEPFYPTHLRKENSKKEIKKRGPLFRGSPAVIVLIASGQKLFG